MILRVVKFHVGFKGMMLCQKYTKLAIKHKQGEKNGNILDCITCLVHIDPKQGNPSYLIHFSGIDDHFSFSTMSIPHLKVQFFFFHMTSELR